MNIQRLYALGLSILLAAGVLGGTTAAAQAAELPAAAASSTAQAPAAADDGSAAAVPAPAKWPETIQAAVIARVQMQHADMIYVPLFGSREADKAALAKTAIIVNRLIGKLKPSKEQLVGEDSFFSTNLDVMLTDGTEIYLRFKDSKNVLVYIGEDEYSTVDDLALSELYKLQQSPQSDVSTRSPAIGQTVRMTGSDAPLQHGMVRVFVETPGSSGGYQAPKGIYYPSKRALLVYSAPYSEARYDFQFTMPAYGEAIDGSFKPITPGKYELDVDTGASMTMRSVTIAPPAAAQFVINGVVVSDPALAPVVKNGVMLLPMRALAEAFGWDVKWDAAHKAAFVSSLSEVPAASLGSSTALSLWVNGEQLAGANAKPVVVKGSIYLPLRATAEAFGFHIEWTQSVRGAFLTFMPQLLKESLYAGDARKLAAVKLMNGYVNALNGRDVSALGKLFVKNAAPATVIETIGQRLITGIRSVTFEDRPGGTLLANATFTYLFDPNGNKSGTPGIVFALEDGVWKIADVD
ncbi:copper amine oxidase N-terminal domain-containing protein [Paenibacillus rhizovicinus]|uniref:Copper amine oxidase N-terminal domain-containing protein n=1 Tax=Paenibacillus rhizovicinus TaxID=2704463 RepID=A0A6C0P3M0_9BACL|nr:copper amine oxidase N-terminal domain-containing protein [Paenibacillus rhizovicinus]QHW32433.1 copper amine oxidase N-terminal domain-containing protein [Paenibacillus rhizovicinus]